MDYQLILQFRGDSMRDYDAMVAFELALVEELGAVADVDGHDVGSGETNIFILTSDPTETLSNARPLMERLGLLENVTIAYRRIDGEDYTVLWPEHFDGIFVVK